MKCTNSCTPLATRGGGQKNVTVIGLKFLPKKTSPYVHISKKKLKDNFLSGESIQDEYVSEMANINIDNI